MNTQISILVKNENIVSRFFSIMWIINIFKKMPVDMIIDNRETEVQRLKASSEPYLIDMAPGYHEIRFTDPRAGGKAAFKAATGGLIGASISAGTGGSFLGGAVMGANAATGNSVKDGLLQCTLKEGDVLKISAQPKRNGTVKIKILKD